MSDLGTCDNGRIPHQGGKVWRKHHCVNWKPLGVVPKPDPAATLRSVLRQLEGNHATWKAIADQYEADSLQVRAIVYRDCADALGPIIRECKAALGDKP